MIIILKYFYNIEGAKRKMVAIKMPHFQIVLLSLLLNGVLSSIIPENHDRRSQVKVKWNLTAHQTTLNLKSIILNANYCTGLLLFYKSSLWIYQQDLSDLEHQLKGGHNAEYDHEAFLGKEKAHEFDRLTPEQSKQRLGYSLLFILFYCCFF